MSKDCHCITMMNEALKPENAKISITVSVTKALGLQSWVCVGVERIDKSKRKELPVVVASYCPFCGESQSPSDKEQGSSQLITQPGEQE